MSHSRPTLGEHFEATSPKRILALDGGGLRGILTLGYLAAIERLLRQRHGGDPDFRLSDYFDLIAGTSTGAIIAAALSLGLTVDEIGSHYRAMGRDVFRKTFTRKGFLRARYDSEKLVSSLKSVLGEERTLGSPDIRTGLLIVTKRMDTGSPWPLNSRRWRRSASAAPNEM